MCRKHRKSVLVGCVVGVYGLMGWLKVVSYTRPSNNLLNYKRWLIKNDNDSEVVIEVEQGQQHGKVFLVRLADCNDRNVAEKYLGCLVHVFLEDLPILSEEIYWHQLQGLKVVLGSDNYGCNGAMLGKVKNLLETGANDVLVVEATCDSIDNKERLLPWLMNKVILKLDLEKREILVDWDPEF